MLPGKAVVTIEGLDGIDGEAWKEKDGAIRAFLAGSAVFHFVGPHGQKIDFNMKVLFGGLVEELSLGTMARFVRVVGQSFLGCSCQHQLRLLQPAGIRIIRRRDEATKNSSQAYVCLEDLLGEISQDELRLMLMQRLREADRELRDRKFQASGILRRVPFLGFVRDVMLRREEIMHSSADLNL